MEDPTAISKASPEEEKKGSTNDPANAMNPPTTGAHAQETLSTPLIKTEPTNIKVESTHTEATSPSKTKGNQPPTVITVDTSKGEDGNSIKPSHPPPSLEAEGRTPKHANKAASAEERTEPEQNDQEKRSGSFFPPRPFEGRMGGGPGGAFQPHPRSLQPGPSPPGNARYYGGGNYPNGPYQPQQGRYERNMHEYHPRMPYGQQQQPHPNMYPPHFQQQGGYGNQPWGPSSHYHGRPPPYHPQHGGGGMMPANYHHPGNPHHQTQGNGHMGSGDGAFSRAVSSSFDRSVKSRSSVDKSGGPHMMEQDPRSGHYPTSMGMHGGDGGSFSDDGSWKQLNQIQSVDEEEMRKRLAAKGATTPTPGNEKAMNAKHANSNSSSLTNSPTEGVGKKQVIPGPPKLTSSLDSLASVSSAQAPMKDAKQQEKIMSPTEEASLDLMKCSSGSSALLLPSASHEKSIGASVHEGRTEPVAGKRSHDESEEGDQAHTEKKESADEPPSKKGRTASMDGKKSPLSIACSPSAEQQKEENKDKVEVDHQSLPHRDSYYDKPLAYSYSLDSMGGARNDFAPLMARPHSSASSTGTPMQVVPSGADRNSSSRPGVSQLLSWEIQGQDSFGGQSTGHNHLSSNFSFSHDYPMSGAGEIPPPPPLPAPPAPTMQARYGDRLESRNQSFEGGHYHGSFSRAETMSFDSTRQGSIVEQRQGYQGPYPPHAPSWGSAGSYPHPSGYPMQPPPQYRMTMQPMIMRNYSQESDARMGVFQPPSEFQAPPTNINRNRQRKETHLMPTPFEPSKSGVFGWTKEEDMRLTEIMKKYKNPRDWEPIAKELDRNRSSKECHERWIRYLKPGVRKGQWTDQEDAIVMEAVTSSKEQPFTRWSDLAQRLPGRVGKQIRDRWVNHLNPNINHLPFSKEDDLLLWEGHQKVGKRWVEIATKFFKGSRSENHIKNRWYSASFKKFIANEFGPNAYNSKGGGGSGGGARSPKKETKKTKGMMHREEDDEDPTFSVGV